MAKKPEISDPQVLDDAVRLLKSDFVALYESQGYDKVFSAAAWHNARISTKGREMLDKINGGRNHVTQQTLTVLADAAKEAEYRSQEKTTHITAIVQSATDSEVDEPQVDDEAPQEQGLQTPPDLGKFRDAKAIDEKVTSKPKAKAKVEDKKQALPKAESKPKKPAKGESKKPASKSTTKSKKSVGKPNGERGARTQIARDLIASGVTDKNVLVEKAGIAPLYAAMLLRNAKKAAKK